MIKRTGAHSRITRPSIILLTAIGVIFFSCEARPNNSGGNQSNPRQSKPHIVLFISDDYSWHDAGAYGAAHVRTPNLDALARDGMRFDAAFAASPTCTPSRSGIYTGMFPFRNGAHANHSLVRDEVRTLPHRMKDLGYRVVIAGKTHIGPRSNFPFEYLENSNVMPAGKDRLLWTDLNTAAVENLLAAHDASRPLCLIVCSHSPHVFWPENDGYEPQKIRLPPYLLDTPETRQALCRYYTDVTWMDEQVGEVRAALARHNYTDKTLFVFTADQGAQFPFAKWNLYDAGMRVPLLVSWPDRVKQGAVSRAMVSLVDLLPTFVEAAGTKINADDFDGSSFLLVLLGKTNRHRDAVFASHTGDGKMNRTPMRVVRTDRYKFILNLAPETTYKTHISEAAPEDGRDYWDSWERAARGGDARAKELIDRYRRRPAEEFYDLRKDPWEQRNLAGVAAYRTTMNEMRDKLRAWRVRQGEDLNKVPLPEDARQGEVPYAK